MQAHLLSQLQVELLDREAIAREGDLLEEGNNVLLPEDALVLLLEVDKRVGGLAVPDVGQPRLDTQAQMVGNDLWFTRQRCQAAGLTEMKLGSFKQARQML